MKITGNIVDIINRKIYFGQLHIEAGKVVSVSPQQGSSPVFILPGFTDAHVHIESSMLVPSEFARLAVVQGTVATVSDPHEIANVLGVEGVRYMIRNGRKVPFKFNFGAPSCVPATSFETAGAEIGVEGIEQLLDLKEIKYLAEMMNYPGVLNDDPVVLAKIAAARSRNKPVDGHAPGLRGEAVDKYIAAGISTDHECFSYEEGLEKIQKGMKVLIREGSAAKNFDALINLLPRFPDRIMFCSDDKHPDDLLTGHINQLVSRAVKKGCDLFDTLQAACVNPVQHYHLEVGLLRPDDPADFIIVEDLQNFKVLSTFIDGRLVAEKGKSLIASVVVPVVNNFKTSPKSASDFICTPRGQQIRVIKAIDGEIVTDSFTGPATIEENNVVADPGRDILKLTVVNRYTDEKPAVAFIQNFNLQSGAIASCVGHDSHNIIAVGCDDESISRAVNLIVEQKGGISAVNGPDQMVLPLPVAGIMSDDDGYQVARDYMVIDNMVKQNMGCRLSAPYMTLSFMALLVIPQLKLSDKGLFDGKTFRFTDVFV